MPRLTGIVDRIAQGGGRDVAARQQRQVELAQGRQGAGGKQQRVAGQERCDHQACREGGSGLQLQ